MTVTSGDAADTVEQESTAVLAGDGLQRGHAWERLERQADWYDRRSVSSRRAYVILKVTQLIAAALVPVMASVHADVWVTGGLGALVVVVEGVQQLFQFESNWISYRSTAEALEREKYLYLAQAGPYAGAPGPKALLAERVETLMSQERANWISGRQQVPQAEHAGRGPGTS